MTSNKKTEAAKVLLAAGWSIEDVTEVLGLNQQDKQNSIDEIMQRYILPPISPLPHITIHPIPVKQNPTEPLQPLKPEYPEINC